MALFPSSNSNDGTTTSSNNPRSSTIIIVVRHGERLDYYLRDEKESNFLTLPTTTRPWDPPLTKRGRLQGRKLGQCLKRVLEENHISEPLTAVYSSPLVRCCQTAAEVINGYQNVTEDDKGLRVTVEPGLIESMNDKWYRSWCLPDSNGTWGGRNSDSSVGINDIDARAKLPIQNLILNPTSIQEYVQSVEENLTNLNFDDSLKEYQDSSINMDVSLTKFVDTSTNNHVYKKAPHYTWNTFETKQELQNRVEETINLLAKKHPNQTTMVLSHGSPCTKLYERLKSDHWENHGDCTYACFSIYRKRNDVEEDMDSWEALVVNNSDHVKEIMKMNKNA